MAKSSRDFQTLVYIRNVTSDLEQYSFDLEMLEVFYAVDGSRTVEEVARDLGKPVNELKGAFARLSRQKLILSAPRRIASEAGGAGFLESNHAIEGASSPSAAGTPQDPAVMQDAASAGSHVQNRVPSGAKPSADPSLNGQSVPDDAFDASAAHAPGESVSRSGALNEDALAYEDLHDLIDAVGNDDDDPFGAEHSPPEGPTWTPSRSFDHGAVASTNDGLGADPDNALDSGDEGWGDEAGADPFGVVEPSDQDPGSSSGDLFSFSRPAMPQSSRTCFDAFARNSPAEVASPTPFASREEAVPAYPYAEDEPREDGKDQSPPLNAKGIEHFENGLAALKDKLYKEALVQFELAGELDPHNRLCKANIQRIRAILGAVE
jgi:hypothetical protein